MSLSEIRSLDIANLEVLEERTYGLLLRLSISYETRRSSHGAVSFGDG
jgi:hypothetical protein